MYDIAIAVTCYNNEEEVLKFAEVIAQQRNSNRVQLLVTCNSCNDYERLYHAMNRVMPEAKVYNPNKNLGYLNGCLYGLTQSTEEYPWVVISNTDIEVMERDFFYMLTKDVEEEVWSIGPDIILKRSGKHQNPYILKRPSKRKLLNWKIAYSSYPLFYLYLRLHELKDKILRSSKEARGTGEVYAVHGSLFCLRHECIKRLLEEQPEIFMYEEELLIAEVVRQNGKKTIYKSEVRAFHLENQVTGRIKMKKKQEWFKASINYIYNRFYR